MLKHFGRLSCPRCATDLVHEFDLASDWVLPGDQTRVDQHWLCPNCGFSRPVVYAVERQRRAAPSDGALTRAIRPLLPKRYG